MSFHSGVAYHDESHDEKDSDIGFEEPVTPVQHHRTSLRKIIFLIVIAITVTFATVFSAVGAAIARHAKYVPKSSEVATKAVSAVTTHQPSSIPKYESCGHSPEEAQARGCHFDLMSFVWLTPECYDAGLEQEFLAWGNFTWYTSDDESDETQVSYEVAKLGHQTTWVNWNYHLLHCTFMWRWQHLFMEKEFVGRHLISQDHTKHCQHVIMMDAHENRNKRTIAEVKYPWCVKVGFEGGMYPGKLKN